MDRPDYDAPDAADGIGMHVIHNLSSQITINDANVVVSVTNEGTEEVEFVQAYALFLDGQGNIVGQDNTYVTDNDSEIKPGATITKQLTVYGQALRPSRFISPDAIQAGKHERRKENEKIYVPGTVHPDYAESLCLRKGGYR